MLRGTGKAKKLIKALPLIVLDVMATFTAFIAGSWLMRIDMQSFSFGFLGLYVAYLSLFNVATFTVCQLYNSLWRYASISELNRVVATVTIAAILGDLSAAILFGNTLPFRLYIFAWLVVLVMCGASRFAIRISACAKDWSLFGVTDSAGLPRSLIVGAGETGSLIVKRMQTNKSDVLGTPVGLVDDNSSKLGEYIHGVRVLGSTKDISRLCAEWKVEQIVVAIPSATKSQRDQIYKICMEAGVRTLTFPSISELSPKSGEKIALREVDVSDLLARDEISLDLGKMGYVSGKRVLVTGGGGSIGSEIVRQLLPAKPAQIILFDIYENTTYELYHKIHDDALSEGIDIRVEIGSITHVPALKKCFDLYHPEVVFHAAAHKHVPLMENNPREAIENNVFGTLNLVRLSHEYKCSYFVLISTDKAVNPTNVMGATKRVDEMIVQYYASISDTVFTAVRFGNVLGSHGSVIPLFKRQIQEGGPITVTHKDITRYFMTIPEASRLVITAGALAKGGEIFVLDMGEPVRIYDLAENLIKLSGLRVGQDIEIVETGLRPGEKMYEELLMDTEKLIPTDNKEIRVSVDSSLDLEMVKVNLQKLEACLDLSDESIKQVLHEVVPTYSPDIDYGKKGNQLHV